MTIQKLDWDSEFFGRRIGRIKVDCLGAELREFQCVFDLIYVETTCENDCCAPPSHPEWFDAGRKLTFATATCEGRLDAAITQLTTRSPELQELAWLSGHQSRYRLDPNFTEEEYRRLYTRWIDACLEGQWDATILGIERHDELAGFVTVESMADHARIGLIAVHSDHQGQGLSSQLIRAAKVIAKETGHEELRVSTQHTNEAAVHAYLNRGFDPLSSVQHYHWWMK